MSAFNCDKKYALTLDAQDELHSFRRKFYLKENTYYLDGNSLGLLSKRAEYSLLQSLQDWKGHGIDGWTAGQNPWFTFSERLAEKTAPLIGAKSNETIITGSITSNIHQLIASFYQPNGKRTKIVVDELNFPSDIYALKSQLRLKNLGPDEHLVYVRSKDGRLIQEEDILALLNDEVAILWLPSVLYRSGQLLNIELITKEAHQKGILVGFDLAHSIGAVPHLLHDWGVDFAVWCNYKYLNSGPGGVGGLYVHENHVVTTPGLAGWFGSNKEKQFDLSLEFTPADSAGAFQIGTPHIFSLAPLLGSLEMFEEVGIEKIRRKSLALTSYMMGLVEEELERFGFTIGNPREDNKRGGHVCPEHDEAARICKALKASNVIPDFRSPNVIRLAPIAFYTSSQDVWESIQIIKRIMINEDYKKFMNKRDIIA